MLSDAKLENQYEDELKEIERKISLDPSNFSLYEEKVYLLKYFNQYEELLNYLDEMCTLFPEKGRIFKIKKISILKLKKELHQGLELINTLLDDTPDDQEILCYKALWMQLLHKKEESLQIMEYLTKRGSKNGLFLDIYQCSPYIRKR